MERLPWCLRHSKESACNSGDLGLIPGLGRSPGGGQGNRPVFLAEHDISMCGVLKQTYKAFFFFFIEFVIIGKTDKSILG